MAWVCDGRSLFSMTSAAVLQVCRTVLFHGPFRVVWQVLFFVVSLERVLVLSRRRRCIVHRQQDGPFVRCFFKHFRDHLNVLFCDAVQQREFNVSTDVVGVFAVFSKIRRTTNESSIFVPDNTIQVGDTVAVKVFRLAQFFLCHGPSCLQTDVFGHIAHRKRLVQDVQQSFRVTEVVGLNVTGKAKGRHCVSNLENALFAS